MKRFTFVEFMIILAIIGILAAMFAPAIIPSLRSDASYKANTIPINSTRFTVVENVRIPTINGRVLGSIVRDENEVEYLFVFYNARLVIERLGE